MRKLSILAALLGLLSAPVAAADVTSKASTFGADAAVAAPVANWTGFYIGAQAGGNFSIIGAEEGSGGLAADGLIGGGRAGFDIARGQFVFGLFGEYNWSNAELAIDPISIFQKDNEWTVGARAGILVAPRTLVYLLGGYTQADFSSALLGGSETFNGWTAGGGLEVLTSGNFSIGLEGTRTWYDEESVFGEDISLEDTRVMAVARVKLNSGLFGGN